MGHIYNFGEVCNEWWVDHTLTLGFLYLPNVHLSLAQLTESYHLVS